MNLAELKAENAMLRARIAKLEGQHNVKSVPEPSITAAANSVFGEGELTKHQIERYSRQMLLGDVGSAGTSILLKSSALVVGAGGLGSTVIPYLAAAGVGRIVVVDFDEVDESNLHRQVIHTESRVGMKKALSAKIMANQLNSGVIVEAICEPFDVSTAQRLCRDVDVVIDASDNVACRYLVNDAAVMEGKPLVSGCATRWEGQLTVYNYPISEEGECVPSPQQCADAEHAQQPIQGHTAATRGPCYRCLFPVPPPSTSVGSCNEVGVVGPIPGTIGCLQALEAIKVLLVLGKRNMIRDAAASPHNVEQKVKGCQTGEKRERPQDELGEPLAQSPPLNSFLSSKTNIDVLAGRLLLFDGLRSTYRTVRLRGKQPSCKICNPENRSGFSTLVEAQLDQQLFPEYQTGVACELPDSAPRVDGQGGMLTERTGIRCREETVEKFASMIESKKVSTDRAVGLSPSPIIVDVRPAAQQAMFTLPNTKFVIDHDLFERNTAQYADDIIAEIERSLTNEGHARPVAVHFLCRRGNKSRKAIFALAPIIQQRLLERDGTNLQPSDIELVNVIGGLTYWTSKVDPTFPVV